MLSPAPSKKACRCCGKQFLPRTTLHVLCSPRCLLRESKAREAADKAQFKERKEQAKTRPQLLAAAQDAFNAFIRARDAGLPCICCGQPFEPDKPGGSVDAGHWISRGAAPHLRYTEDNCFAQRKNCNMPGGTTRAKFRAGVIERIGLERALAVEADQSSPKWTHDDLRAIKTTYVAKLKQLKENT